jgi:hypothetical protein
MSLRVMRLEKLAAPVARAAEADTLARALVENKILNARTSVARGLRVRDLIHVSSSLP